MEIWKKMGIMVLVLSLTAGPGYAAAGAIGGVGTRPGGPELTLQDFKSIYRGSKPVVAHREYSRYAMQSDERRVEEAIFPERPIVPTEPGHGARTR